jgi:hypothetical protein
LLLGDGQRANEIHTFGVREWLLTYARYILLSDVGGLDGVGFFSSGCDSKYMTTGAESGTDLADLRVLIEDLV